MKIIISAILLMISVAGTAVAFDMSNAWYVSPYAGYRFFDDKEDLENNPEFGLRFGKFLTENIAAEGGLGYINSNYEDTGDDENLVVLDANALYHFKVSEDKKVMPYVQAGIEGRNYGKTLWGVDAGFGFKYLYNKNIGGDLNLKNVYFGQGRHDQVVSLSLNFYYGVKDEKEPVTVVIPVKKEEPKPEPVKEEPVKPSVEEKPAESFAKAEEPEKKETMAVAAVGDADNDGVNDDEDMCPGTMASVVVDEYGCFHSMDLEVYFPFDSAKVQKKYMGRISEFAGFMKKNTILKAEIQGHTDSIGTEEYNKALSERRAEAVMKKLTGEFGIAEERLSSIGYGEEQPIADNSNPEGRQKNRRIETKLLTKYGGNVESQSK
ncbi:OmpA family protein [Limisalsivibrio acetivorans]|uniref:OmpA family protein n=1 Tax=Limisalsivibrio acetivorans TaxID=1304888 RepID=UPI0003B68AB8|nr:OmpA family protein [Limisalsivibrio acetivorans]